MREPVIATALLIALTGWCVLHGVSGIAGGRCADRRLEAAEIVMALAVVAMMAPAFDPLPQGLWAALLAASAAWPARRRPARAGRHHDGDPASPGARAHYAHHVVGASAMAALAVAPKHRHTGGSGVHEAVHAAVPAWTLFLLAAYFLAYAAVGVASLLLPRPTTGRYPALDRGPGPPAPLRLVSARRTVMAIGMFYMLVGMS
ncbi:DUF5134 domain-containing protein [Kitasatospora griseola]|uniref:DUF5134 domain-containing protein n=1 Tax=Kitasatospora griseola TaxID=2064 RepID=UPI0016706205|nr:DUF5134 domain-containing protein [Kitasatospora griseola]GGQ64510.1 hypothetical protein GCM10010195_20070 [Kitasatospora griseola]